MSHGVYLTTLDIECLLDRINRIFRLFLLNRQDAKHAKGFSLDLPDRDKQSGKDQALTGGQVKAWASNMGWRGMEYFSGTDFTDDTDLSFLVCAAFNFNPFAKINEESYFDTGSFEIY